MASLDSVRQKIFRAALHAKSLEPELQRYFETNPGKLVMEPNSPPDKPSFILQAKEPMPARFGLIIGDCFQNLRSSLDYLVWELVLAENNEPGKHNMCPICRAPETFKDAVNKSRRLAGVHPDAIAEIEALQPYNLEKDMEKSTLLVLDELTNINKHRRVLLTMLRGGPSNIEVIDANGELWAGGAMPVLDGNTKITATISSGQMQVDTQVFACVTFDEGAAKGLEVTTCLNEWIHYVLNGVIPMFERFFV